LTICKRLVEMMEGNLGVTSEPGSGSTFFFTAQFALGGRQASGTHELHPVEVSGHSTRVEIEAALQGSHILLVEDNEMNLQFATEVLGRAGIQVDVAVNGREALEKVACFHYDCVLMDCQMPIMDGFEATRLIRADARFSTLPIIAMTANAMAGDRERCANAGMDDHIAKPIDIEQMLQTLAHWIRPGAGARRAALAGGSTPVPACVEAAQVGVAAAMIRLGGDHELFNSMLEWFLKGQSATATRMRSAIARGDHITAQRLAHTLKGAADGIGATGLCAAAYRLEQVLRDSPGTIAGSVLDSVESLLALQLAEIAHKLGSIALVPATPNGPATDAALAPLVRQMAQLLANDDAQALELKDPLAMLLADGAFAADFNRLSALLEDYSLNEALTVLRGIASKMNIALDESQMT
jgi:CheY-like chemotaxis protein/HPt (histidine-containing phosphotransfer) domain-containing protein